MEITNTQKILRYYLEYEIYNILNISQIKLDNETSFIVEKAQDIRKNLEKIKETKIKNEIKKIVGKRGVNQQELLNQINLRLIGLYRDESNKLKIISEVENLMQGKLGNNINKNVIKNFAEEVCNIKNIQEFWLYAHNITYMRNGSIQRLPIFILKCILEDTEVKVLEVNINKESLNKILSEVLEKELSDVVIENEEKLTNYESQIKGMIDGGDINHLIKIYYAIMKETIGISEEDIENTLKGVTFHRQYIISLDELAEAGIKNIKEDIELINKLINNDSYIPNVLDKYLSGSSCKKKDFNDQKYEKFYKGNYKSKFGINENQYRIVNTIKDNDLIAIEGPPGTGKTSLLKEIIANSIVERANLILENWNKELKVNNYFDTKYYEIEWFNNKIDVIKSIVVSSKNGEAIENVGKEINKEIRYMYPIARKYERLELDGKEYKKIIQQYKGMVCLPLGKQTNIKDFKDFLYYLYIPILNKLQEKENLDEYFNAIRKRYKDKYIEIKEFEEIIEKLKNINNKEQYSFGVMSKEKEEIRKIESIFFKKKDEYENQIEKLRLNKKRIKQKKEEIERNLKINLNELNIVKKELRECQKGIIDRENTIEDLQNEKRNFESIKHNFIARILNSNYKKNKNLNFEKQIYELNVTNEIEKARVTEFIRKENVINDKKRKLEQKKKQIECDYEDFENKLKDIEKQIKEMQLIEKFNKLDNKKYWSYTSNIEMCGSSYLNVLNQELFELALRLNEAYIIKNSKQIVENLKVFLPDSEFSHICQKFYDSTEMYNKDKQKGIKNLWNTLFLCFPVVTTTLDSFSKRCFHLLPEYIDLELIDESGQILPHNLVPALYRGRKAIIVGDVNQIEPIYSTRHNFDKYQKMIGTQFSSIRIDDSSAQVLANINTDILSKGEPIILNDHYRCEENIINFSNQNVYNKRLKLHKRDDMDKPFFNNMVLLDVRGKRYKDKNVNRVEIESCIAAIKYILKHDKSKEKPSIAVITPFKEQKAEIESKLKKEKIEDVKVGTVHAFQGQERDYIIFSQVIDSLTKRSSLGFIGRKCNMLNVAVTRAKKQFIFLGNMDVATKIKNYSTKLVNYIENNGAVYSLYDTENRVSKNNWNKEILQVLQPELNVGSDKIGMYINKFIESGVIFDAKQHYDFLKYAIENAESEIYIMSPWFNNNVMDDAFFESIKRLKKINGKIRMYFGYKKGNTNVTEAKELVQELKKSNSLGFAKEEVAESIINKMYQLIGKESFVYAPPTHAKVLIIDDKYMCMGSHNWLSNAGKSNQSQRATEGSIITTSVDAISYVKEEILNNSTNYKRKNEYKKM